MPVREWAQGFTPPEGDGVDPVQAFRDGVVEEYGRDEAAWHAQESNLTGENTRLTQELQETRAANWALLQQLPSKKAAEIPSPETVETPEKKMEDLKARIFKPLEG
jgi:hypothetical protein